MSRPLFRRLAWTAAILGFLAGAMLAVWLWLPGYVVRSVLEMAGASNVRFTAVRGLPWHLEIERLSCRFATHAISAKRVVLDRPRWWRASLGAVRVEGFEWPVVLDGSDVNPWSWSTYENAAFAGDSVQLPVSTLDLQGHLVVQEAGLPDMPIAVRLEGKPKGDLAWIGSLQAEGPGFRLAGTGSLLRAGQELEFQVHSSELDLATWSQHLQRLILLPGAPWELTGKLTAVGEGKVTAKRFASTARFTLRDGQVRVRARDVTAERVEADLEFSDLWKYRTKSGALRIGRLRVGKLAATDLTGEIGLWGASTVIVNGACGSLLGGSIEIAPFRYLLAQREVRLGLQARGVDVAQLLALAPEVPAQMEGRIDLTLPVRIDGNGVRLEPGEATLSPGGPAALQFSAGPLLRSGATLDAESARLLKTLGSRLARVRLDEFRLEVRPPDVPLGSSARICFSGTLENQSLAASLSVNGSLERYLEIVR